MGKGDSTDVALNDLSTFPLCCTLYTCCIIQTEYNMGFVEVCS